MKILQIYFLVMVVSVTSSLAQVTVVGWWRQGENDGAISIGSVTNLSTGWAGDGTTYNLNREGTAIYYSSDVPSASLLSLGASTVSMYFNPAGTQYNGYYYSLNGTPPMTTHTTSFGIEAWIKASNTTGSVGEIIGLGSTTTGYHIVQNGANIEVRYGSYNTRISYTGLQAGEWTHVAFVGDSDTGTLYVNGSAVGSYATATLASTYATVPGDYLSIGEQAKYPGYQAFSGYIDEARYFTYTGSFDVSMLNYTAVPEPATYTGLAGLISLGLAAVLRRRNTTRA